MHIDKTSPTAPLIGLNYNQNIFTITYSSTYVRQTSSVLNKYDSVIIILESDVYICTRYHAFGGNKELKEKRNRKIQILCQQNSFYQFVWVETFYET